MHDNKFGDLISDDEIFQRLILDGVETNYFVSSYGRVWSENKNGYLSTNIDKRSGRRRTCICVNGKEYRMLISRLIALTFLGSGEGLDADHIDNDCTNDVLSNIQWLSPVENKKKMHSTGKIKIPYSKPGDESNNHVYTEEIIHEVCRMMECGHDIKYISQKTNVSLAVIQSIKTGKNWTTVSSKYNISNSQPTKPKKLPKELNEFIKQKIIEGYTNKQIEKFVKEQFDVTGVYASITNHRRRMKGKGII